MAFVIGETCIDVQDKSCMTQCPADCIFEGGRMTYVNPETCIDCGACVSACPVEAIFYEAELPEDQEHFLEINEAFFETHGAGTGGRKAGKILFDVADVLAMPKREVNS